MRTRTDNAGRSSRTRRRGGAAGSFPGYLFFLLLLTSCLWQASASAGQEADEDALWRMLASGSHIALLRHAVAPGTGDPANFAIGDCSTQRNLSDAGRQQAIRIGRRFLAEGISRAAVFSSQWCRCLETARLLNLGTVRELPLLNSFFRDFERKAEQTKGLRQWLAELKMTGPHVLVTHQVNITALTGVFPQSGELVVVQRLDSGDLTVAGTIMTQ